MVRYYFDHNATTPLDPRVAAAMRPWLEERFGNPSSVHSFGREAREAVEGARDEVATLLGVDAPEVVFTASGTEANNAVIWSAARGAGLRGHLVVSALEHPAVLRAAEAVESLGMEVTVVPPAPDGVVAAEAFLDALREETVLAALMLANNELGTLQPVAEVAVGCQTRGVPLLTDAVQAAGKVPVAARELGADFVVVGAHKFHGPLGAAALWIRGGAPFEPLLVGGSQERRRRASTVNVAAVVGLGAAARLAREELDERAARLAALRDRFERGMRTIPGAMVHCAGVPRLPSTSHVAFPGVHGQDLMIRLDLEGFAVSTGSACGSGSVEVSPTLAAMGMEEREALGSLRVSFGTTNTEEEVDALLAALTAEVAALRRATARVARPDSPEPHANVRSAPTPAVEDEVAPGPGARRAGGNAG